MENGDAGGLSNMTEVGFCFERRVVVVVVGGGRGAVCRGVGDGWFAGEGKLVLMSRRNSGPPWTAPQPPNPGRP